VPQRQAPLAQLSDRPLVSHDTQTAPPMPQLDTTPGDTQVPPATQQPAQPLVVSHTHIVPLHRWPGKQDGYAPHRHCPFAPQALDFCGSQLQQPAPAVPHDAGKLVAWQVVPLQQPAGQLAASQTQPPPLHR